VDVDLLLLGLSRYGAALLLSYLVLMMMMLYRVATTKDITALLYLMEEGVLHAELNLGRVAERSGMSGTISEPVFSDCGAVPGRGSIALYI
jgi:hypothetical protein